MAKNTVDHDEQLSELRDLVADADGESATPKKKTDRRGMLKMAGAALLGAAGAAAVRAVPASAASGSYMVTGCINTETSATQVSGVNTIGTPALGAQGGIGLQGQGNASTTSSEVGVLGTSKNGNGTGIQGHVSGAGVGIQGMSHGGTAGWFEDTNGGYDLLLGQAISGTVADPNFHGTGRLAMVGRTDVGGSGPNIPVTFLTHSTLFAGGHFQHELIRGNDGSIWASRNDVTGPTSSNQFRWKRINSVRTDTTDGLGTPFKPFRVIDSRSGAKQGAGAAPHVVTVAGLGSGASSIPGDAVAVMGNLTAVGYTGAGWMAIMPGGIVIGTGAGQFNPASDPSSVNFIVGQAAIANSFICGLHNGQVQVYCAVSPSWFIIDITAYLQ